MSGPLPAPPSVTTADGHRVVISGVGTPAAVLTYDTPSTAHWAQTVWGAPPNSLGGGTLDGWLKADKIPAGIADGAALTSWVDQSVNARNFNTLSGGTLPVYRAAGGPRGLPCIDHTVAAGGLSTASGIVTMTAITYFIVMQRVGAGVQTIYNGAQGNTAEVRVTATGQIELLISGVSSVGISATVLPLNQWSLVLVTLTTAGALYFDINEHHRKLRGRPEELPRGFRCVLRLPPRRNPVRGKDGRTRPV